MGLTQDLIDHVYAIKYDTLPEEARDVERQKSPHVDHFGLDPEPGEPSPYVLVRGQLEAKLARPVFYELANMAEPAPDGSDMLGVWSQGVFFPLGPAA